MRFIHLALWIATLVTLSTGQFYFLYPARMVRNGQLEAGATTLGQCLTACGSQRPQCAGFDFSQATSSCYLHDAASECGPLEVVMSSTHVRFFNCDATTVIAPTSGAGGIATTAKPLVMPPLSSLDPSLDLQIPNGIPIMFATTIESCYSVCYNSKTCQAFDWYNNKCYCHKMETACNDLRYQIGSVHYKLKANCSPVLPNCFNVQFETFPAEKRSGGLLIGSNVDFDRCQVLCRARTTCQAVDWDRMQRICYEHSTTGRPSPNSCCEHARKICSDGTTPEIRQATTRPITTTAAQPTTRPPKITTPSSLIPDDGKCPSELLAVKDTVSPGGIDVPDIANPDECKQWCIDEENCTAVEFDMTATDGMLCRYHDNETDVEATAETDTCCTQYRKLSSCESKKCWTMARQQVSTEISVSGSTIFAPDDTVFNLASGNMTSDPDITLEECEGLCKISADFSREKNGTLNTLYPAEAERSCDTSFTILDFKKSSSKKNCITKVTDEDPVTGVQNITLECYCSSDQCNALWVEVLDSCIAHFPLDHSAKDVTFGRKNGRAFNVYYSSIEQVKNGSAMFNGSSFIQADTFRNNLFGQITPDAVDNIRPEFTLFFWFKFTERIAENMSLINNGPPGRASIDIYTAAVDDTQRDIYASIRIDKQTFEGKVSALYDEWQYFALRIFPFANYDILLDVGNNTDVTDSLGVDTGISIDSSVSIDTVGFPLCIGKQYIPTTQRFLPELSNYFTGYLDEIYMFGRGLDNFELNSLVQLSYFPVRLNPH